MGPQRSGNTHKRLALQNGSISRKRGGKRQAPAPKNPEAGAGRGNYNPAFSLPQRNVAYQTLSEGLLHWQRGLRPCPSRRWMTCQEAIRFSLFRGIVGEALHRGERTMIATEKYARANWWCPARRNRVVTTGISGFNLSIFPVKIQWKQALIAWLFPNYFWVNIGRHGKCLGSGCATWRWHEFKRTGWCGLAPKPEC